MNRTDSPLQQLLAGPSADDRDRLKVKLLDEFHRGRPASDLRALLRSHDGNAVQAGIWIASELGGSGKPLLPDIVPLLSHAETSVRFFALDCVLNWATAADRLALVSAVLLIYDPTVPVRWKVLHFLSAASTEQLQAARSQLEQKAGPTTLISGLSWLLSPDAQDPSQVLARLRGPDALLRKFGVVAATRLSRVNEQPLIDACDNSDPEVRQFAADMLAIN
jgi:hypothetical protein